MSKKRTGLLVGLGCGLLFCLPLCAGALGGGVWLVLAMPEELASFDPGAYMPEELMAVGAEEEAPVTETPEAPEAPEELAELEQAPEDADDEGALDSGLDEVAEVAPEDDAPEAHIVVEPDGQNTITNTEPRPSAPPLATRPPPGDKRAAPEPVQPKSQPQPKPEPEPLDDEEDFDDIAAEIAELDSLDAPSGKEVPADKPGTIKVTGDVDRASVIGSDGVYRSPGKFDPGVYRVEITLEDGTTLTERVNLKSGETVKLRCDVDEGACTR